RGSAPRFARGAWRSRVRRTLPRKEIEATVGESTQAWGALCHFTPLPQSGGYTGPSAFPLDFTPLARGDDERRPAPRAGAAAIAADHGRRGPLAGGASPGRHA